MSYSSLGWGRNIYIYSSIGWTRARARQSRGIYSNIGWGRGIMLGSGRVRYIYSTIGVRNSGKVGQGICSLCRCWV